MITHEDHNDGSDSPYYPRIILCVPGPWSGPADFALRLQAGPFRLEGEKLSTADGAERFDAEYRGPDPRMRNAFQVSACRLRPSLTPADFTAVQNHRGVIYVLSDAFGRSGAAAAARRMMEVGRALLDAGGIAMKCESSGIAHSASRWRELTDPFEAFVRLPILGEAEELYSCGMHLLGRADGLVELKEFPGRDLMGATRTLERFLRGSTDGAEAAPEPCLRYAQDDFMWNRWGYLRLRRTT